MAHVVVRDRYGKVVQKVTLEKAIVIGRSAECDVRVRDTRVSREHCELTPVDGGWALRDRGSRNGTFVNGKSVREHQLRDGDVVEVGSNRIGFFAGSSRRARAADPVLAGLVDAESLPGSSAGSTWEPPGLSSTESSLFATRVMVAASGESTVAGGVVASQPIAEGRVPAAGQNVRSESAKPFGKKRGTLVGALGGVTSWAAILRFWK